jgi:hypothetical protein
MPSRATAPVEIVNNPREPFDFPTTIKSVTFKGVTYTFRELTLAENDECRDAAKQPNGEVDGILQTRLMVCAASVEPKIKLEDLAKVPLRLYSRFYEIIIELHDEETLEGND